MYVAPVLIAEMVKKLLLHSADGSHNASKHTKQCCAMGTNCWHSDGCTLYADGDNWCHFKGAYEEAFLCGGLFPSRIAVVHAAMPTALHALVHVV